MANAFHQIARHLDGIDRRMCAMEEKSRISNDSNDSIMEHEKIINETTDAFSKLSCEYARLMAVVDAATVKINILEDKVLELENNADVDRRRS